MGFGYIHKMRGYFLISILITLFIGVSSAFAATVTSVATGNWNTGTTWDSGTPPTSADDVVIAAGHTVTFDAGSAAVLSLSVNATGTFDMNGGTLTLTNGVTINGNIDDNAGGSVITLGGNFTINSGATFNNSANGIDVNFNGSGTQAIGGTYASSSLEFYNFTLSGTGAVTNNLTTTIIVSGQFNESAGTFNAGSSTYNLGYGVLNGNAFNKTGGTFNAGTSTIKITSTVNIHMSIDANTSFYKIVHAPPSGARTLTFDETNAGAAVYTITNTLEFQTNSRGAAFANSASIGYSGTTTLSYTTPNNIAIGNEWPTTNPPTNVTFNSTATFTLGSNRAVSGTFTQTGGGTFDVSAGTLTINGTFSKGSGSFTTSGGALSYGSSAVLSYTATQTAGVEWKASVPNVTISSGTVTLAAASGTRTITNALTVTSTLTANDNAINCGSFTDNGSMTTTNAAVTVTNNASFGSSATLNTGGGNFSAGGNLTLNSNAGLTTGGGSVSVTGTSSLTTATISSSAGNVSLTGNVTMSLASTISTTGSVTLSGNLDVTNGGTIGTTTAGTLVMGGSSTTTVNIDGSITLFNFTVNKTGGASTIVTPSVSVDFKFNTNGTLYVQQGVLQMTAASSFKNASGALLSASDNVTLKIDANGTLKTEDVGITGFNVFTLADGSTVEFSGTAAQDIPAATYGNITVSTTHTNGATLAGAVTLQTNSTVTVSGSSRLNLNGKVITHPGTNSDDLTVANSGKLYTGGTDITGFNTYLFNGTVVYNGTSQETMAPSDAANIEIDNAAGVVLSSNVLIGTSLKFTNGKITSTATKRLNLVVGVTDQSTATSFVVGPVGIVANGSSSFKSFSFPVGNGSNHRNVTLAFTTAPGANDTLIVEAKGTTASATSTLSGVKSVETDGYWTISSSPTDTYSAYTATFNVSGFSPQITSSSKVTMVRGTDPNYNAEQGTSPTASTDQIVASFTSGTAAFGDFAVGNLASTYTWTGTTNNNWSVGTNWDLGSAPGNGDVVSIPTGSTVIYDASVSASNYSSVTLTGSATLSLDGAIFDFNGTSFTLGSTGTLTFNGATINNYNGANTTYPSGSTVQYNTGTVQADAYGNLVVNNSGSVSSSGTITVAGNFTKSGAGTYTATGAVSVTGTTTLTAGTIDPSGGFTASGNIVGNGGQFSASSGTVTLNGASQQSISGSTGITFNNLTLNNSNGLSITTGPTVEGVLTLSAGLITTGSTNASNLTIGSAGSISGASSTRYISGRLAKVYPTGAPSFTYPTGKGGEYLPLTLNFASLTSGYTRVVEQINSDANGKDPDVDSGSLSKVSTVRYWEVSRVGTGGGISGGIQMTLSYNANDGVDVSATKLDVAQLSTDVNGAAAAIGVWQSLGGDGTGLTSGTILSGVFTSGGDFYTLGDAAGAGADNSLPVELSAFEATPDFDKVDLNWTTSSELKNLGFNIYRKGSENTDWVAVNEEIIPGKGTYSAESNYSYTDKNVVAGHTYSYKLESVSYDGAVTVEQIIKIDVPVPQEYALFKNYPNPFNPTTHIKFQVPEYSTVTIVIYDISGREVKTLINKTGYDAGKYEVTWNATDNFENKVASGMYFYRFSAGAFNKMGRMILLK